MNNANINDLIGTLAILTLQVQEIRDHLELPARAVHALPTYRGACAGFNRDGDPCRIKKLYENGYCIYHDPLGRGRRCAGIGRKNKPCRRLAEPPSHFCDTHGA